MDRRQDAHHILFPRQEWTLRADSERLREVHLLKPLMDREVHNELHRNCPPIPALGHIALFRVQREFHTGDDVFETMENLMTAIETANQSPKAHRFERELGKLIIAGIDIQRPYIKEGLVR